MVLNMTTKTFSNLDYKEIKKVFADFLGHKVNQIVSGGMTNEKWGQFYVRHDGCAYSRIKVDPTESGLTELTIYNYSTKEWQTEPGCKKEA